MRWRRRTGVVGLVRVLLALVESVLGLCVSDLAVLVVDLSRVSVCRAGISGGLLRESYLVTGLVD